MGFSVLEGWSGSDSSWSPPCVEPLLLAREDTTLDTYLSDKSSSPSWVKDPVSFPLAPLGCPGFSKSLEDIVITIIHKNFDDRQILNLRKVSEREHNKDEDKIRVTAYWCSLA
jgi:hypothetical protein